MRSKIVTIARRPMLNLGCQRKVQHGPDVAGVGYNQTGHDVDIGPRLDDPDFLGKECIEEVARPHWLGMAQGNHLAHRTDPRTIGELRPSPRRWSSACGLHNWICCR